jgi:type III secretion protein N (ATPase)
MPELGAFIEAAVQHARSIEPVTLTHFRVEGRLVTVNGQVLRARLPQAPIGTLCRLLAGGRFELAEVVGFEGDETILAPLGGVEGLTRGDRIISLGSRHAMRFPRSPLGWVFDGFGRATGRVPSAEHVGSDDAGQWDASRLHVVMGEAPDPVSRPMVTETMPTGIRAVDAFTTLGLGQRVGVFAGPGAGKTTLLSAIARGAQADAVVFALIGERGRELREFLERSVPPSLARRCAVVCATSDRSALERVRAASTAMTIAEALRDRGGNVLLLVDSVTRLARAQREIGIAAGEPLTHSGLTPSVFAALPRLIERAGTSTRGTITGVFAVLLEGPIEEDPLASELKSLLDAHIVLSSELAQQGQYPAVDVLSSLSRLQAHLVSDLHLKAAERVRQLMASYRQVEFLIRVGEYQRGTDPEADDAIEAAPAVREFLRQDLRTPCELDQCVAALAEIAATRARARQS